MNGVHDMGGMHGFGRVEPEPDEPSFHEAWEGRVLAMQRAMRLTRAWNIDMSRFAQERLPAPTYLLASYYQRWLLGMERCVLEQGLVFSDELQAGHMLRPGKPVPRATTGNIVQTFDRGSFSRPAHAQPRFRPGDRVRTRNIHPEGHTRLPRYARDRTGLVEAVRGCHVYPDAVTSGGGEDPQWLYTVVFDGRELWGPQADPSLKVSIEAFEPYLGAAT